MISWSQQSPNPWSLSSTSQWASFFPHKRPLLISLDLGTGQLPHRRVMHGPGVRPSHHGVARHRAPRMARQARSAPNPTALLQVGYDLLDLDSGQSSLLQRRGPALAERFATPCAAHQANLLPALAPVHPELAALGRPLAKGGTGRIRTGELRQLPLERSFCLFHAPRTTRKLPFVHLSPATRQIPRLKLLTPDPRPPSGGGGLFFQSHQHCPLPGSEVFGTTSGNELEPAVATTG